ncbi:MAG: 2Fe-2S iron-sulfur cluster binding domain-containing protein, partial [Flavobacteriaceae bacterium]|nr:2Fe-2S iron-sulfur cluster binding domain-containing protein [Flavobacteriaceae bacterium]
MNPIVASIIFSLVLILILVAILLVAKAKLLPSGKVKILINKEKEVEVPMGGSLLSTLGDQGIFLPSACGGGGTCIQCTCKVQSGGGDALPTETPHFTRKELAA